MTTSTSGAWIPGVGICQSMGPQTQRRTDNTRGDLHLPLRAVQRLFSYNFLFVYGMERTDVSEVGDNTGGPRGVGRPFEISGSTTIHTVPLGVEKMSLLLSSSSAEQRVPSANPFNADSAVRF